jgi:hypothetical protein
VYGGYTNGYLYQYAHLYLVMHRFWWWHQFGHLHRQPRLRGGHALVGCGLFGFVYANQ